MSTANETQVGGEHYKKRKIQHWDMVAAHGLNYFSANASKYLCRWRDKNGLQDLQKMVHYIAKQIEALEVPPEVDMEEFCKEQELDDAQYIILRFLFHAERTYDLSDAKKYLNVALQAAQKYLADQTERAAVAAAETVGSEPTAQGYVNQD